jgi:RimJ/RimL family protein N-acetyltransferase
MIATERLRLVPATSEQLQAALDGPDALATALGAEVPATWPPEFLDDAAFEFTLERLREDPRQADWWLHFIGSAGYKGPPSADGVVEVGYGIVRDQRRRGFASEAMRGLLGRAFDEPGVRTVIAETLPELVGSIGVLGKCGFRLTGEGSEPDVIRFELARDAYRANDAAGGRQ